VPGSILSRECKIHDDDSSDMGDDAPRLPSLALKTERRIHSKQRPLLRTARPPTSPSTKGLKRKNSSEQWREWATGIERFIGMAAFDCGCDLHDNGCYAWIANTVRISFADLQQVVKERTLHRKELYEKLRNNLHSSATLVEGHSDVYSLQYKVLGIHSVCRAAFMWITATPVSTLQDAETDFKTGKNTWGHASRKSTVDKCDAKITPLKRDLASDYIKEIVLWQSEDQPNGGAGEVDVGVGDDDSDAEDVVWCRSSNGSWSVQGEPKCTGGVMKTKAKKHMDPLVVKELFKEYEVDKQIEGLDPNHVVSYSLLNSLYKEVLKPMLVFVRKNKGVSGRYVAV
jgi:hypothetical protein